MNSKQIFSKKTIHDIDLQGKRVLLRVDWDIPWDNDGNITDDYRLAHSLPTISYIMEHGASIVIIAHRGRPKDHEPEMSLKHVAEQLGRRLNKTVQFVSDCVGREVVETANQLKIGEVLVCENLRFHPEEKANDPDFARQLATLGEVFVQNAFANTHRDHASMTGVTKYLPSVAGLLIEQEISAITHAVQDPQQPVVAITGGAKLETKLPLLEQFMKIANRIVIGGVMANTMLVAKGYQIGKSIYDEAELNVAKEMLNKAKESNTELLLPLQDVAVGESVDVTNRRVVATDSVGENDLILDFGQKSIDSVIEAIKPAATIIWNGPLGYFENPLFAIGSNTLAKAIADSSATSIVGGGDTADVINSLGLVDKFTHVSTGGGASLELMAGKYLPAVEALLDK